MRKTHQAALGVLLAAQFMLIVDVMVLNVALPSIQRGLQVPDGRLQLASIAYTVTFGSLLMVAGRAGDLFGRRRVFVSGVVVFTVASALTGAAQDATQLFAGRALQGIGAAMVSPTALSLLTATFAEGRARNRALGLWAAVGSGGAIAGQILGGVVADLLGWRWVFLFNVPVGVLAVLAARRLFAESRAEQRPGLDLGGAVMMTGGAAAATLALARAAEHGPDAVAGGMVLLSAALLATLVRIERRHPAPLVGAAVLRVPGVRVGNTVLALIAGGTAAALYFATLHLQRVLDWSPLQVGFAFAPVTLLVLVVSPIAGRVVGRTGVRPLLVAGCAVTAAGFGWLAAAAAPGVHPGHLLASLAVVATGNGIAFAPAMIAATSGVRAADPGLASGILSTCQELGTALGLAILAAVALAASGTGTGGYRAGFLGAVVLAAAATLAGSRAPRSLGRTAAQPGVPVTSP